MAQQDLTKMSVEDLEGYIQSIGEQVDALRAEQERAHALIDELNAAAAAEERVKNLSSVERAALEQALKTVPIPSDEAVAEPEAAAE